MENGRMCGPWGGSRRGEGVLATNRPIGKPRMLMEPPPCSQGLLYVGGYHGDRCLCQVQAPRTTRVPRQPPYVVLRGGVRLILDRVRRDVWSGRLKHAPTTNMFALRRTTCTNDTRTHTNTLLCQPCSGQGQHFPDFPAPLTRALRCLVKRQPLSMRLLFVFFTFMVQ